MNLNLSLGRFVKVVQLFFDSEPMKQSDYLHLLGSLIYLTKTRTEIATGVSFVATYAMKPTRVAFDEMLHVL
jgi:hypothetical protein